jgi:hypothetical protein
VNTFEPQLSDLVSECLSTLATIYPITYSVHTVEQSPAKYSISSANKEPSAGKEPSANKEPSVIFCVQNKQDWQSAAACLEKHDEQAQQHNYVGNVLICLMGEYQSIWFEQVATYTHLVISFQVLPQVLELSSTADYKQGRIPFSPLSLHLESAIKHLNDTADYSIFIEKLDFSDIGLKNALKINEAAELNKTDNLAGLQYEDDASEKSSSQDTKVSDALTSSLKVSSEDATAAHKYIERNIVERISAPAFIDYKTYIGIPRKGPQLKANTTVCDSANSRGLKVNRQFDAVELFQIWQTQSVVESNISVYTKAK